MHEKGYVTWIYIKSRESTWELVSETSFGNLLGKKREDCKWHTREYVKWGSVFERQSLCNEDDSYPFDIYHAFKQDPTLKNKR